MDMLLLYNTLNDDVISVIFEFIPTEILSLCNRKNWIQNYKKQLTKKSLNRSYYRFLLRNDFYIIFEHFFDYYYNIFIKKKKIYYKTYVFQNHLDLLTHLSSQEYNSQKCLKIIIDKRKTGRQKKKKYIYKNKKLISNKWSN